MPCEYQSQLLNIKKNKNTTLGRELKEFRFSSKYIIGFPNLQNKISKRTIKKLFRIQ